MGLLRSAGLGDKRTSVVLLVLLLLLATLLRFYALDAKSLWFDEVATWVHATVGDVGDVLSNVLNKELPASPVHFLLVHFFILVSDSDFLLRFLSVAFGILTIAAAYSLGTRLFGRETGLLSACLLAISPFHIRYSQEARCYSLLALLSMLSLYCLWRAMLGRELRWWPGFVACTVLNLYTHLFALLVILVEVIFISGLWLCGAFRRKGLLQSRRMALVCVVSLLVISVLYAPMMPYLFRGMTRQVGLASMGRGMDATVDFFLGMLGSWGSGPGLDLWAFLAIFLIGIIGSARSHGTQLWLTICWMVVPFLALYAVQAKHGVHTRYMIFILPIYLLTVARGLTVLGLGAGSRLPRRWQRGGSVVLIVAISGLAASSLGRAYSYYKEDRADWRAVASFLGHMVAPGEVIVSPGALPSVVLPRYHERLEEMEFLRGGSEAFLHSTSCKDSGVWFVARRARNLETIERDLREESFLVFKVVFPVDRESAEAAIAIDVGPMYYDLAVLYVRDGLESQEIVARYHRSLDVVPPRAAAYIHTTLGNLHRMEGRMDEAMTHYQEAASLDPGASEPHYGLALVYEAQGLWEQYFREWQRYEELANASK